MEQKITVKEFIEEYLIKQVGEIKTKYPYLSLLIMCMGIEFLGKCLNDKAWTTSGCSKIDFNEAVDEMFPDGISSIDVYKDLRCGLAHGMHINCSVSNSPTDRCVLDVATFYCSFVKLCKKLTSDKNRQELMNKEFFHIENHNNISITGTTNADTDKAK